MPLNAFLLRSDYKSVNRLINLRNGLLLSINNNIESHWVFFCLCLVNYSIISFTLRIYIVRKFRLRFESHCTVFFEIQYSKLRKIFRQPFLSRRETLSVTIVSIQVCQLLHENERFLCDLKYTYSNIVMQQTGK